MIQESSTNSFYEFATSTNSSTKLYNLLVLTANDVYFLRSRILPHIRTLDVIFFINVVVRDSLRAPRLIPRTLKLTTI